MNGLLAVPLNAGADHPKGHNGPLVSMVANAMATEPKDVAAAAIVEAIRDGRYKKPVEAIRKLYALTLEKTNDHDAAKKAVDPLKKRLPGVQFSGTFTGRGDKSLAHYSGLLCADLDHLIQEQQTEARAKLTADPHVFALFESPTKTGLKVVIAVQRDAEKHAVNFLAVKQHVLDVCGLAVDESCKNVERLCFVSHDPDAYLNPDALPLPSVANEPQSAPAPPCAPTAAPVRNGVLRSIDFELRRKVADKVLGAITWQSGTVGFCECPAWQTHSTQTNPKDCRITLDNVPTLFCLHESCRATVDAFNHKLRSAIGKAESPAGHYRRGSAAAEYLASEGQDQEETDPVLAAPDWPAPLDAAAFHGLTGEVVRVIEPHTEADPAAVMVMFLVAFGNMAGACAYFVAESCRHYARLFGVLVGETAKGRKGSGATCAICWST
jgi:hypothetical protein